MSHIVHKCISHRSPPKMLLYQNTKQIKPETRPRWPPSGLAHDSSIDRYELGISHGGLRWKFMHFNIIRFILNSHMDKDVLKEIGLSLFGHQHLRRCLHKFGAL